MDIKQALQLKVGDKVQFPADRGSPAGYATVRHSVVPDSIPNKNIHGVEYVWVPLIYGSLAVWPSNRLTFVCSKEQAVLNPKYGERNSNRRRK